MIAFCLCINLGNIYISCEIQWELSPEKKAFLYFEYRAESVYNNDKYNKGGNKADRVLFLQSERTTK